MDKAELEKLINLKLPNKPTHDELAYHVRQQKKLVDYVLEVLVRHGQSLIELREQQVEVRADLLASGVTRRGEEPLIIMPDPPKLEIPN